jgi:hypothetical protein
MSLIIRGMGRLREADPLDKVFHRDAGGGGAAGKRRRIQELRA